MGIRVLHKILCPDASVLSERWVSRSPESMAALCPIGELLLCSDRPLCGTVLIPADAREVNDAAIRWQERWVASYLPQVLEYVQ